MKKSKKKAHQKAPKKTNKTKKTELPNEVSEEEFLKVLDIISKRLIYKFKFGYHEIEDMKQQAAIFAIEGLKKYDRSRPLENFLWTHVRNRLFNYKRDNFQRPDKPCLTCPFYDALCAKSKSQCTEFDNKENCSLYANWSDRNNRKKNIMKPSYIEHDIEQNKLSILDNISNQELSDYIEKNIPTKYRETYLKLKNGCKVSRSDLDKLKEQIKHIIDNQHE